MRLAIKILLLLVFSAPRMFGASAAFAVVKPGNVGITVTTNTVSGVNVYTVSGNGSPGTNDAMRNGTGVNVRSNGLSDFTFFANTNDINSYVSNYSKAVVFVATNGNNATAIRGKSSLPFLNLTAAQAVMLDGDICYVGPGNYTNVPGTFTNLLYRTNCTFFLDRNTVLGTIGNVGEVCIAVTNGSLTVDGNGIIVSDVILDNSILLVKNCGLFACGGGTGQDIFSIGLTRITNQIQIQNATAVYIGLDSASNLLFTCTADLVVELGTLNLDGVSVNVRCRRFGIGSTGGAAITMPYGINSTCWIDASIVDIPNCQMAPNYDASVKNKCVIRAGVFSIKGDESCTVLGGTSVQGINVWPGAPDGTITNGESNVGGFWQVNTNIVIPNETTIYSAFIGI